MLLGGVALGLIAGLLAGGRLEYLVAVRLRWLAILFVAVIVRFVTEAALTRGVDIADQLRIPLLAAAYGLLAFGLWVNRRHPGLSIALVGVLSNGAVILVNGGRMPIWEPSLGAAGFTLADVQSHFHIILPAVLDGSFLLHAGPLSDLIPVPFPVIQNVASIGDVFLAAGLAFFLFATVVRAPDELDSEAAGPGRQLSGLAGTARLPRTIEAVVTGRAVRAETGLVSGLAEAAALERPTLLGGSGPGLLAPALAPLPLDLETSVALPRPTAIPGVAPLERVRRHPYVRLALNGSFSALWMGQLISLFGDRINQIALAFLVLRATNGSALAVGFVFVAGTIPNLLLGPIAGTLVDRWDQKQVLVASDLLRAATVLIVPVAAVTDILLVYPLVFLVTSISIFFRPARSAVLPRIVRDDELMTANSAAWVGETLADVIGYPLAGLFVGFLGAALPLAFWVDSATYVASAILVLSMAIPPLLQGRGGAARTAQVREEATETDERGTAEGRPAEGAGQAGAGEPGTVGLLADVRADLVAGWRFLRREPVLLANTLQGVAGQFSSGAVIALTPVYASQALAGGIDSTVSYAMLETAVGIGSLGGGLVLGLVGARLPRGRAVILGYALGGLCIAGLAATGSLAVAFGLMLGIGIANMIFVIPSQTLFQERTPPGMIGRVVGIRFSMVFGSMTLAMAVSGGVAQAVGVGAVLAACGVVMLAAGLAGLLVPAVRNA